MRRGYVMQSRRSAASTQIAILEADGVSNLYVEGQKGITFDDAVTSLRAGQPLEVASIADLATTREDLRERIERVHEAGSYVREVSTGRDTRTDMMELIFDAVDLLGKRRKGHDAKKAREYGALGGRPRKKRETSDEDAEKRWFNTVKYKTNEDAAAACPGWDVNALWKRFGKSGRQPGPRVEGDE